eukprot:CAMPEP_0198235914 /NCGR_PEP_ID=MMETSP1446-20131203/1808_1 /TAXON_ID=1461542 ORGANISM="Unidentified sp, Strain CCMP2111" /NCGR_SAMPLE_ID=MMETSP1446 /ASSEMBLY_ACC=CAM_ASM_001112 /LENGTH=274 /DNA_ID=CAMNT_0043917359 /DNA_START=221 /DNA_END=1042 /DNA_ORIENTATION=+
MAAALAVICMWGVLFNIRNSLITRPLHLADTICKPPSENSLDGFVYICSGKGCDQSFLCYSIFLLRTVSMWKGPVYIVSDQQEFIHHTACSYHNPLALRDDSPSFNYTTIPTPPAPTLMHMKNYKRQLFTLVGRNATKLIYIDADILPVGCLGKFLDEEAPSELGMFHDSLCANCNKYLGGFIYMRREPETQQCLDAWSEEAARDDFSRYDKDQKALDQLLGKKGPCNSIIRTLPYSYIETFDNYVLLPFMGFLTHKTPVFQHFSHGIRNMPIW